MAKEKAESNGELATQKAGAKATASTKETLHLVRPFGSNKLPKEFVEAVAGVEKHLGMNVWLLIQQQDGDCGMLDDYVYDALLSARAEFDRSKPVALVVDSGGGLARSAYQIAQLFQKESTEFVAIVPRFAKSAATLLCLGASRLILGEYAELGPLDAQLHDVEREEGISCLDEVQSLQRLHAEALRFLDQTMIHMVTRSHKKLETLLPVVTEWVSSMFRPLFEKFDVVHYTQRARTLKVAEEYARRLLEPRYPPEVARKVASSLVSGYPDHEFVIDVGEAKRIDLVVENADQQLQVLIETMISSMPRMNAVGRIKEVTP